MKKIWKMKINRILTRIMMNQKMICNKQNQKLLRKKVVQNR